MKPTAKITAIRPIVCDTGHGRNFLFVLVDTDVGITGVGEGSQNNQDAAVVANVRQLAPRYLGQDPLDVIESRVRMLTSNRTGRAIFVAVSAIEQALWDVAGKLLGVPIYQLLGGHCHERLRCYATISAGVHDYTPEGQADEATRCVADGYSAVKVVPFRRLNSSNFDSPEGRRIFQEGIARVAAVREAVGPDVDVLIECAFAFNLATAKRAASALEPYSCFWLEAPLLWDDVPELSRLRQTIPQRVASGETLHGRRAFREIIERQAVDVLQPDVKWTGGILEAKKIAAWSETYQISIAPHNNSGPVATAASAHLSATLPNFLILETPSQIPEWEVDLLRGSSMLRDGHVALEYLSQRPGLGVEFDEAVARKHECTL
ncbi:mandelate racemase/muconate lactonizing enzyme family protein [bacterium]|nr:mandelate racemase/muconate lactonizing enzyme family protein [bacterium]